MGNELDRLALSRRRFLQQASLLGLLGLLGGGAAMTAAVVDPAAFRQRRAQAEQ